MIIIPEESVLKQVFRTVCSLLRLRRKTEREYYFYKLPLSKRATVVDQDVLFSCNFKLKEQLFLSALIRKVSLTLFTYKHFFIEGRTGNPAVTVLIKTRISLFCFVQANWLFEKFGRVDIQKLGGLQRLS